jgi:flagellar basal body-associated protein FliL
MSEFIKLTDEQVKARKRRNIAIAMGLLVFIATVYAITVSRMHANNEARKAAEAAHNAELGVTVSQPQAVAPAGEEGQ